MRFRLVGLLGLIVAVIAGPAAAQIMLPAEAAARKGTILLQPSSPWNIDFGESRCRLARIFKSEDAEHILFIEQGAPRAQFSLTMAGPELRHFSGYSSVLIGTSSDEPLHELPRAGKGKVEGYGEALIIGSMRIDDRFEQDDYSDDSSSKGDGKIDRKQTFAGIDPVEAGTIERIVLTRGKRGLSFETGNMKAPIEALNLCSSDLLIRWGLDPDQHKKYSPPRMINSRTVVRSIQAKYPTRALRSGEQGIFRLRAIVGADGSVSDCVIENATITERLESPACIEMRKAKFEPALDADGSPMRSFYATTVTYSVN
jgi:TonB family protein